MAADAGKAVSAMSCAPSAARAPEVAAPGSDWRAVEAAFPEKDATAAGPSMGASGTQIVPAAAASFSAKN